MRSRILLTLSLFASLGLGVAFAGDAGGDTASDFPNHWFFYEGKKQEEHAQIEGKPMPGLALTNWQNGEFKPADLKGKVIVLDIWATWCGPCLAALPHTSEISEKYKDKGVVVIAVCGSGFEGGKFEKVVKDRKVTAPAAIPVDAEKLVKDWRVSWWPTYAVIDQKGIVRGVGLRPDHVGDAIEKLLAEKAEK